MEQKAQLEEKEAPRLGEKLEFSGVGERSVYNISAPFQSGEMTLIAGRVEAPEAWADSHVMFFQENDGIWVPAEGAPAFKLEDGFATRIGEELIFGGVEVYIDPATHHPELNPRSISYRTVFYRGTDVSSLTKFAVGPDMMKDIRLASLPSGRIAVFTRPQGGQYGRGNIGYVRLESLDDLNAQNILSAKIIENQFSPGEWGGANELHVLDDGTIGVLGHIAHEDAEGGKHYYAMSFVYNPETHSASPVQIIATRRNFPPGKKKMPELEDVVFPGGMIRHGDGTATLYAGLSDIEAGRITRPDPFKNKGAS